MVFAFYFLFFNLLSIFYSHFLSYPEAIWDLVEHSVVSRGRFDGNWQS